MALTHANDLAPSDREPTWEDLSLCAQTDPESFFPLSLTKAETASARRVCEGCDVAFECLQGAVDRNETFGVWGGARPSDIREIRRRGGDAAGWLASRAHGPTLRRLDGAGRVLPFGEIDGDVLPVRRLVGRGA